MFWVREGGAGGGGVVCCGVGDGLVGGDRYPGVCGSGYSIQAMK